MSQAVSHLLGVLAVLEEVGLLAEAAEEGGSAPRQGAVHERV